MSDWDKSIITSHEKHNYDYLEIKKLNTYLGYHPQCDGMVETFNWALPDMHLPGVHTVG